MKEGSLSRQWKYELEKYLDSKCCKIESRKRHAGDGPAVQDFCVALGVQLADYKDKRNKLAGLIHKIRDHLIAHAAQASQSDGPRSQSAPARETQMPDAIAAEIANQRYAL